MRIAATLFGLVALIGGCAGISPADEKSGELYYRHAGGPVDQIRFANLLEWRPVGSEAVLLRFDGGRHYLFEVTPECGIDLRWSRRLSLIQRTRNQVNTFDRISLDGLACRIVEIRPVDFEAVKAELRSRGEPAPEFRRNAGSVAG